MSNHGVSGLPAFSNRVPSPPRRKVRQVKMEVQGHLCKLHVQSPSKAVKKEKALTDEQRERKNTAGKRGKIIGFSRSSRGRCKEMLARVSDAILPLFFTLTLPNMMHCFEGRFPTATEMHLCLENFRKRLCREFPKYAAIWKIEIQDKRYSKILRGVPTSQGNLESGLPLHFHLLAWGLHGVSLKRLRALVASAWQESIKASSPARTEVAKIKSYRGVVSYASKYLCKLTLQPKASLSMLHIPPSLEGRVWGVHNKDEIPWADRREVVADIGAWFHRMRRSAKTRVAHFGWKLNTSVLQGFKLMLDGVQEWFDFGVGMILQGLISSPEGKNGA